MKLQIGGIAVRFHWFFLLLAFGLAFQGYLAETVMLFGLVFCHEVVHALVARSCGLEVGAVEIFPFGGVASIEDVLEMDPDIETRVALAGPLFNFFLAALALVVYANFPHWQANEFFHFFIRCNLVLGLFNLLPALPLDGGRILRAKITPLMGFQKATDAAIAISRLVALLIAMAGLYLFYLGHFHLTLFAASFFLFYAAAKEKTAAVYSLVRSLSLKRRVFMKNGAIHLVTLMALEDMLLKEILRLFALKKYHRVIVVSKNGHVLGEVMESDIVDTIMKKGIYADLRSVLANGKKE